MSKSTVTISTEAFDFAEKKAKEMGMPSAGADVEWLVEKMRRREERRSRVEALLIHGLDSGPLVPVTREDMDRIRREVREALRSRANVR